MNWKQYGKNIGNELKGTSGATLAAGSTIAGVVQGLAAAGLFTATAHLAVGLTVVGSVIGVGGLLIGAVRAIPPKRESADKYSCEEVTLKQLMELDPPLKRIGIIGNTEAGKTTLIKKILLQAPPNERTQRVRAHIAPMHTTPVTYVALIDGGGEEPSHQFKVATPADLLIVVLDHNISHESSVIDEERLSKTLEQQRQIIVHLKDEDQIKTRKSVVFILGNKRDLWKDSAPDDVRRFIAFAKHVEDNWKLSNIADRVEYREHSNRGDEHISSFLQVLYKEIERKD